MLKLEAGKRYWRRDGGLSGPLRHNKDAVPSFWFDDGLNSWYEEGRYTNSEERPYDLIREYIEPQPLEWKRGIPTEEECRECWIVTGESGHVPVPGYVFAQRELTAANETFSNKSWYIALRIKPVEPPKPKTKTQSQYTSKTGEELWTDAGVGHSQYWTPTGLTREVPA